MDLKKCRIGFSFFIFIIAAFSGCAAPNPNLDNGNVPHELLRPGIYIVHHPSVRPGETIDSAKNDLAKILTTGSAEVVGYATAHRTTAPVQSCSVRDNLIRMQMSWGRLDWQLDDLLECDILVTEIKNNPASARFDIHISNRPLSSFRTESAPNGKHKDLISFFFNKNALAEAQKFADDLFYIQQWMKNDLDKQLAVFNSRAAQYRALTKKPPVSEKQRKYIVQANAANQQKDYSGAIEMYRKALDVDPTSYPGAYFNLALLSAQVKRFNPAIGYMKQYLSLVPDAADARSAQDKIYEWEFMLRKQE